MRHAESPYNVLGLCNDRPAPGRALTDQGVEQARQAARVLAPVPLQRICCSELPRARRTAEIVNEHHSAPITVSSLINDIRTGFNGRPAREHFRAIAADPLNARPPGGESRLEHKERVAAFLGWLRAQPEDTILTVAHEETLRVVRAYFEGLDDRSMLGLSFANCERLRYQLPAGPR